MVSLHARVREYVFVILTTLFFAVAGAFAENIDHLWPQFHGPHRDNISRETGFLKTWPDEGPSLVWTANGLGHGFSSVSIADGRICTAGNIDKDTVITALNMKGKVLWRSKNGKAWTKDYPGTRGTPTIDGTRIYHQNPLGNIVCLKTETGEVVWEVDILTKVRSKNSRWALAESLLIGICLAGQSPFLAMKRPFDCMKKANRMLYGTRKPRFRPQKPRLRR